MTGITAYSAYIPLYRLARKTISTAIGWIGQAGSMAGEKAIANYDEDSVTMAVAAGMNCLKETDRTQVDGVVRAQLSNLLIRDDRDILLLRVAAPGQVGLPAEVEILRLVGKTLFFRDGFENLHAFAQHFRSRAVAAEYCYSYH